MSRLEFRLLFLTVLLVSTAWLPLQAQTTTAGSVTVAVTSSANPSIFAAPVSFSVAVKASASNGTAPTGTVIASLPGPYEVGAVTLDGKGAGVITVPQNVGLFASTAVGLPAGSNNLTFSYSGDANYKAAQSQLTQFVQKADTSVVAAVGSGGQPSRVTATVSINEPTVTTLAFVLPGNLSSSSPTGTVQFFNGTVLFGMAKLTPSGLFTSTATLLTDAIPASVTAIYAGDDNYNGGSSSGTGGGGGGGTATLTATSTVNQATFAEPVTLNISVTSAAAAAVPAGTVTANLSGLFSLGSATLDSSGHASIDIPRNLNSAISSVPWGLPVGSDSITVNYSGDGRYGATQTTVSQMVTKADTATAAVLRTANGGAFSVIATVSIHETSVTPIAFVLPGSSSGSTSPTGNVQFMSGSTVLGNATLTAGGHLQSAATLTLPQAPTATTDIFAVYNGDGNYNGSTSPAATQPVSGVAVIGVTSSANPSTFAQPVTFSVTVAPQVHGGPTPTGSVTATVLGSDTLASAALDANGSASFVVPNQNSSSASPVMPWGLATGGNVITVSYSGDTNYGAGKTNFTQLVNQAHTSTALLLPPVAVGTGYVFQATVQIDENSVSKTNFNIPAGGNLSTSPSGTVMFYNGNTLVGTANLTAGGLFEATATLKSNTAPAAAHAVYGGDTNYSGSNSGTVGTGGAPVSVTLATSSAQAIYGGAFTVVGTVAPANGSGPTPSGTLTFYDGGQSLGWVATLDSSGKGSLNVPIPLATALVCAPQCSAPEVRVLGAGTHTITVSYSGDANYAAATPSASVTETITKAPTATSLSGVTASLLPPVTSVLTATVSDAQPPTGGPYRFLIAGASGFTEGAPSGTVQFFAGGTSIGTANLAPNISGNVSSSAALSATTSSGALSAVYPGDANFQGSTSPAGTASTSVKLSSSANPSTVGQSVTLTAALTPSTATGTVEFLDGVLVLGHATVSNGSASLTVSFSAAGSNVLTAVYNGDANDLPATSPSLTQVVTAGSTQEVLTLTASPFIAVYGQTIKLTATLVGSVTTAPTGTVKFLDGTTQIGSGKLSSNGVAAATVTLGVGLYQITAAYDGDANWKAVTSGVVTLAVLRASTNTVLTISGKTLTATVTAAKPGAGTPTGTVQFLSLLNGSVLGTATLQGGVATLTVSTASAVSTAVRAVYLGDTNFNASSSQLSSAIHPTPGR